MPHGKASRHSRFLQQRRHSHPRLGLAKQHQRVEHCHQQPAEVEATEQEEIM